MKRRLALIGLVSAVLLPTGGVGARSIPATRLVYEGVAVVGDHQIYSVERSGAGAAQLTFAAAPSSSPLPSPDARLVLFRRENDLWIMRADGGDQRRLVRVGDAAWAPDSRSVAYVRAGEIREIGVDGKHDRLLVREPSGEIGAPTWSPDGRRLALSRADTVVIRAGRTERVLRFKGGAQPIAWSPNGRWIAVRWGRKLILVDPQGGDRRFVDVAQSAVWSPDGRRLAYVQAPKTNDYSSLAALRIFDTRTGDHRFLTYDVATWSSPTWSPRGDEVAYVSRADGLPKALKLAGLTPPEYLDAPYFDGIAGTFAWTRVPAGLRFQQPLPYAVAAQDELEARAPIQELSVDGDKAAFGFCSSFALWAMQTESVVALRSERGPLCSGDGESFQGLYSLALAGDRAAWDRYMGGNYGETTVLVTSVGSGNTTTIASGGAHTDKRDRISDVIGHGDLLIFSGRKLCEDVPDPSGRSCAADPESQRRTLGQTIWRIREPGWQGSCPFGFGPNGPVLEPGPCQELATEPGPFVPTDVDAGRIVALGDNAVVVMDAQGARILDLPIKAITAQLTGANLVVLVQGSLRVYDVASGALTAAWQLPDVLSAGTCRAASCGRTPRLRFDDAGHGLVAYLLDGELHLLRIRDGADAVVADATAAQFGDTGLFYAHEEAYPWKGRIRFVPFDRLPLR